MFTVIQMLEYKNTKSVIKKEKLLTISFIVILIYHLNGKFVTQILQIRYSSQSMFENPTVSFKCTLQLMCEDRVLFV